MKYLLDRESDSFNALSSLGWDIGNIINSLDPADTNIPMATLILHHKTARGEKDIEWWHFHKKDIPYRDCGEVRYIDMALLILQAKKV